MDVFLILQGAQAPNAALALNRVALGAFFAIGGYHKLFNASRHATLTRTLQDDAVHALPIMQWLLPSVEFGGGVRAHHWFIVRARGVRAFRDLFRGTCTRRRQTDTCMAAN
jgi:hypothetical protein